MATPPAAQRTYWFWHECWACAGWQRDRLSLAGLATPTPPPASLMDTYIATVGHGGVLNFNAAPDARGRMNASVVAVMQQAGKALNDTFKLNNAGVTDGAQSGPCVDGVCGRC